MLEMVLITNRTMETFFLFTEVLNFFAVMVVTGDFVSILMILFIQGENQIIGDQIFSVKLVRFITTNAEDLLLLRILLQCTFFAYEMETAYEYWNSLRLIDV